MISLFSFNAMAANAMAADYSFTTDAPQDYYGDTSYEDIYGSQYNYGGPNVVDFQIHGDAQGRYLQCADAAVLTFQTIHAGDRCLLGRAGHGSGIQAAVDLGHTVRADAVADGNIGVCGHNRGSKYVIGSIKDLQQGDTITYTTKLGTPVPGRQRW